MFSVTGVGCVLAPPLPLSGHRIHGRVGRATFDDVIARRIGGIEVEVA
jgi:hypothetical protein